MNMKEGMQDKRVFILLATPPQATPPFREPILLQRNENYLTSIIHLLALLFQEHFFLSDVEEIFVLPVTLEFSPLGFVLLWDIPDSIVKWELQCSAELVSFSTSTFVAVLGSRYNIVMVPEGLTLL
jgi:hypothetical protein